MPRFEPEVIVEVVLMITAACGLIGCFGVVARLDVSRRVDRQARPLSRCVVRPIG